MIAKYAVTMPSRCAVTSLLVYNQCVIYHLVTDDSNFGYFNSLVERLKAIYSFSYCYELNDSRFYLPFSSFPKEENGDGTDFLVTPNGDTTV